MFYTSCHPEGASAPEGSPGRSIEILRLVDRIPDHLLPGSRFLFRRVYSPSDACEYRAMYADTSNLSFAARVLWYRTVP